MEREIARIGIFVFYDKEGIVDNYIIYLLHNIRYVLARLVVVVNEPIRKDELKKFNRIADAVYIRKNDGLDVAAWKFAMTQYIGWDNIGKFDEIVLFNGTVFGPFLPFKGIFAEMDKRDVDFWGMTCHYGISQWNKPCSSTKNMPTHIQTYFLVIRKKMHVSEVFHRYWEEMSVYQTYDEVVCKHEVMFTEFFHKHGYTWDVFVDTRDRIMVPDVRNYNPMIVEPFQLVRSRKCPFLKIKNFGLDVRNHLICNHGGELSRTLAYLRQNDIYPVDLIWQYLLRKFPISQIFNVLALRYILPVNMGKNSLGRKLLKRVLIAVYFDDDEAIDICGEYLRQIPQGIFIHILVDSQERKVLVKQRLQRRPNSYEIEIAESGSYFFSFLHVMKKKLADYDYICFIHGKSIPTEFFPPARIDVRTSFCENLLASSSYVMNVLSVFEGNPRLGLVVPPPSCLGYDVASIQKRQWTSCQGLLASMRQQLGISIPYEAKPREAVSWGNVFWCRTKALKRLWNVVWRMDTSPEIFDTATQAMQYLLPQIAQQEGYYTAWVMTPREAALGGRNAGCAMNYGL